MPSPLTTGLDFSDLRKVVLFILQLAVLRSNPETRDRKCSIPESVHQEKSVPDCFRDRTYPTVKYFGVKSDEKNCRSPGNGAYRFNLLDGSTIERLEDERLGPDFRTDLSTAARSRKSMKLNRKVHIDHPADTGATQTWDSITAANTTTPAPLATAAPFIVASTTATATAATATPTTSTTITSAPQAFNLPNLTSPLEDGSLSGTGAMRTNLTDDNQDSRSILEDKGNLFVMRSLFLV